MAVLKMILLPYHLARLALFAFAVLPYFQWKTWRAKIVFKRELLRNGIPGELADNLAAIYGNGSKSIITIAFRRNSEVYREAP